MTLPMVPPPILTGAQYTKRLYFTDEAPTYTPSVKASWNYTAFGETCKLKIRPAGSSNQVLWSKGVVGNYNSLLMHAISEPLFSPITISGNFQFCVGANWLTDPAAGASFCLWAWVTTGNSSTVRGYLKQETITTYVGPAFSYNAAQGKARGATALSTVNAQIGDRIVVELGVYAASEAASYYTWHGATGSPDLTDGDVNVTTRPGWFEFSTPLPLPD